MPDLTKNTDVKNQSKSPLAFFALVFALSLPLWAVGAVIDLELMPGLPLSSFIVVSPTLAAVILCWRDLGREQAITFLARAFDFRRLRAPLVIAMLLLVNPLIYIASYLAQTTIGVDLPAPDIQLLPVLSLLVIFFVAATLEELGWTGYVLEPLQQRWGLVGAGFVIGVVWAVWHFIPLAQADRALVWVAWWTIGTVAARVLMVWLYGHSGQSVFGMSMYHALSNVCWQTYPVNGSYFDPRINALVTLTLLVAVLLPWAIRGGKSRPPRE